MPESAGSQYDLFYFSSLIYGNSYFSSLSFGLQETEPTSADELPNLHCGGGGGGDDASGGGSAIAGGLRAAQRRFHEAAEESPRPPPPRRRRRPPRSPFLTSPVNLQSAMLLLSRAERRSIITI